MKDCVRNRIRNTWHQMITRCYDETASNYKYYGGKGVRVFEEWRNSFQSFYEWSLANGYDHTLTIDRIDVNGDYSPYNCRWVDMKTQCNNRSNNIIIEFNGEKHTIPEWSTILGIKQYVIRNRLNRGWSVDEALSRKVGNYVYKN